MRITTESMNARKKEGKEGYAALDSGEESER